MSVTLETLARELGAELHGAGDLPISGLGTIGTANESQITFLANPRYRSYLENTRAAAVLLQEDQLEHCPVAALVVKDPYLAFARASHFFDTTPRPAAGIHSSASVDSSARVEDGASIGPNVVLEAGVVIGRGSVIGANSVVGAGSCLGEDCRLWPNVTIYHGVIIGARTTIHANSVVGSDGFGFAPGPEGWTKIAQVGGVRIGSDVEIGAGTTIDRGAIEDTVIGNGAILDNQIQVAHNVVIGEHTALAGKVGISGSTRIGAYCMIGGAVGISGHLEICDRVQILGMSLVSRSIREPGTYGSALPVDRQDRYRRNVARFRHLDELHRRVRRLERGSDDHGSDD